MNAKRNPPRRAGVAPLFLAAALGLAAAGCGEKATFVTIGTGAMTGVYYPTGGFIAKFVNAKDDVYGIRCTVESTPGSVFNINAIMSGDMEFGIAQSDRQYEAVNGIAEWAKLGPQTNLRAVFSIHNESVTLVASEESGIRSLHDLKGKRVNIGSPGTGGRQNAIDVLQAAGIDYEKDMKAESVKAGDAPDLLRDSRIDAFFYTVGHPNGTIKEATAGKRKAVIVPIDGIGNLIDTHPYYAPAEIDLSHYEQAANAADGKTPTFAVKAVLLTSAQVPDDIVYAITKEVFDNLEQFKTLHEAFADLTREGMLLGLTAPIHPGAMRYFKESGLMQ